MIASTLGVVATLAQTYNASEAGSCCPVFLARRGMFDAADRMVQGAGTGANLALGPNDSLTLEAGLGRCQPVAARDEPEKAIGMVLDVLRYSCTDRGRILATLATLVLSIDAPVRYQLMAVVILSVSVMTALWSS
ncbi:hypothetical protein GMORB2_6886 [Geosmithia morbida]|uniref:Uncharacterized protein n=1 Tax=Geosmithia morbida TaxID=1094350 RepID=A0A9P4YTL4_9HYPO|nr:uncharacterized protein GMORB2_6886 [Geosmithia morbida]KAF4122580.1 hypothetical protein GMORB2_6886 [Geosmithia morbida]